MRWFLGLWFVPLGLFWLWYGLSYYDVGGFILSRQFHDLVFLVYAQALGMEPSAIPPLVVKACIFDSMIVGAIYVFGRRKRIMGFARAKGWLPERRVADRRTAIQSGVPSDASLSSAP